MKFNLKKIINYRIIMAIWIIIWLLFFVRGFIRVDYKIFKGTLGSSVDDKTAFSMTKDLYAFILYAKKKLPDDASYEFVYNNLLLDPVENVRMIYYLYPRITKDNPQYVVVFEMPSYKKFGFTLSERFSEGSFILKKNN